MVHKSSRALEKLSTGPIVIAADTEFQGIETLTVQLATRLAGGGIAVQVYRAATIPEPSESKLRGCLGMQEPGLVLRIRPAQRITTRLSPVKMLADLFGLKDVRPCPLAEGQRINRSWTANSGPPNGKWDEKKQRWRIPHVTVNIVGHLLRADLLRMFGRDFLAALLGKTEDRAPPLAIRDSRVIGFSGANPYLPPVVEYACCGDGSVFEIRLKTADTNEMYGHESLDRLSKAFLGTGKLEIDDFDKARMKNEFRRDPTRAYSYAILDAVITLRVYEGIQRRHEQTYELLGYSYDEVPPIRNTLGARDDELIRLTLGRTSAAGSRILNSTTALKNLMRGGSREAAEESHTSRFGEQTFSVHGGLQFSRSPTQLCHLSPGMLRDVDMASCYSSIAAKIPVYFGRPIIYEPGANQMRLPDAIRFLDKEAARDGWFVRVSGEFPSTMNSLIPSSPYAVTPRELTSRHPARRRRQEADNDRSAKLFAQEIRSGIVTAATWTVIQALPSKSRNEYSKLNVDSMVFYPAKYVAEDAAAFDKLWEQRKGEGPYWRAELDLDNNRIRESFEIREEHISLRFRLDELMKRLLQERKKAQQRDGKGSAIDYALKQQVNAMYGVLASRNLSVSNYVAANTMTAHARAEAFAITLALNAFQVITDGVTFRKDRVPACTFRECLRYQSDYQFRHATDESGITFLDPATIPDDVPGVTAWLREHVKGFFEVDEGAWDDLFDTHEIEFKSSGGAISFDALLCDGPANYVKCVQNANGELETLDAAMRGSGPKSKGILVAWMLKTYPTDRMRTLPPVTIDTNLLKFNDAVSATKRALADDREIQRAIFPLAFEAKKVRNYSVIRPSTFLFQNQAQWRAFKKQEKKFREKKGCGLEVLCQRRGYDHRVRGSLTQLLEKIYELVRAGNRDFTKALQLNRSLRKKLESISRNRLKKIRRNKNAARGKLRGQIDISLAPPSHTVTNLILTRKTCPWT